MLNNIHSLEGGGTVGGGGTVWRVVGLFGGALWTVRKEGGGLLGRWAIRRDLWAVWEVGWFGGGCLEGSMGC